MPSNNFVSALLQICIEENSTVSVEAIRNAAFAKMVAGELKSTTNGSLNGKSFTFQYSKPADVMFAETSEAIRLFNGGIITEVYGDFSTL